MAYRYSEAQNKANQRYQKKTYDRIYVWIKKGKREIYKQLADSKGLSLAALVTGLLDREAIAAGLMEPADSEPAETETETED